MTTPLPWVTGRFRLEPDPPVAGQPLEVTYLGPATEIEWQVDDRKPVKVRPDKNGRFLIDPVPSADELMLSDRLGIEGYRHTKIMHLG